MRLSNERYEEIKETICEFLCDYDVKKLPVDVFDLARRMKVKIVYASEILKKYPNKINEYMIYSYPHSYLYYDAVEQRFIIYLDDVGTKKRRQRFSLAHELIHIILGHTEQNLKNESEANFGATYLLAPTCLALMDQGALEMFDPNILMEIFDVSYSEAQIVARYFENRVFYDNPIQPYEKELIARFGKSFIKRFKIYK
ncbi:MAG: ImmA/IrrE family metallo-endopeptidase [Acholeplasmatales bacterium]|nr:ImmA/IrrE family metallo-endopeptidase [Acholeplasmatales bacterium]